MRTRSSGSSAAAAPAAAAGLTAVPATLNEVSAPPAEEAAAAAVGSGRGGAPARKGIDGADADAATPNLFSIDDSAADATPGGGL